jgi:hypothetical protein
MVSTARTVERTCLPCGDQNRPFVCMGVDMSVGTDGSPATDDFGAAVAEVVENRAVIEQAKGMLMFVYGMDADAAFELLRLRSQHSNVKLRLLAEQIVADLTKASQRHPPGDRRALDDVVRTAHLRMSSG